MAGVQDSALTIAVSTSGGLGSLPCAVLSTEVLAKELESIDSAGIRCYNLNFFCHPQPRLDTRGERRWRDALAPYYREHGIDPEVVASVPTRSPFSEEALERIRPFRPPVVSFHFGLPNRDWIDEIKSWGGQIWSSATTLEEAQWLAEHGVDAVIAQGIEAGGHRGMFLTEDLSTQMEAMRLLTEIKRHVDLPIIAAGGIASPEQVKEALDRGAWAVQCGTAYLCCVEAKTRQLHRAQIRSKCAATTQVTNVFSGRPARGIVNRLIRELGPMSHITPEFPGAAAALAPLRKAAEAAGKGDFSPLWCGTNTAACREVDAAEQTNWLASKLR